MIFYQSNFPWKIDLIEKLSGRKHTFYESTTDYLDFNENYFNFVIYDK